MFHKIKKMVVFILASFMFPTAVFAEKQPLCAVSSEQKGSICMQLEDMKHNLPKENVHFEIVLVAEVKNGKFVLKKEFEPEGVDLNKVKTAEELGKAAEKFAKVKTEEKIELITDQKGIAEGKDLSTGVYLIQATGIAAYEKIAPSLVSIPVFNEITKRMEYDVEIFPKYAPEPERVITKVPGKFQTGIGDYRIVYATATVAFLGAAMVLVFKGRKHKNQ